MNFKKSEQGFTLIEVIIAFGVLAIGILSMFALLTQGIRGNATANRITTELVHGSDIIEEILGRDYFDIDGNGIGDRATNEDFTGDMDGDGDGIALDTDDDGVADDNDNFGLDHSECCQDGKDPAGDAVAGCVEKADFCFQTPDNRFSVFWNVATNHPDAGMKKIKIIIRAKSGQSPDTVLTSLKVDL